MGVRGICGRVQTDAAGMLTVVSLASIPTSGNVACCSGAESETVLTCAAGEVVVGYRAEASATAPTGVTGLALTCARLLTAGTAQTALDIALGSPSTTVASLGTAIPRYAVDCPAGMVARGMHGTGTTTLQSLGLACTRLEPTLITTSPQYASFGGASIYADCPPGQVPIAVSAASATAFYSGYLDVMVLECGSLLASTDGHGGWITTVSPTGGAVFPSVGAYGTWSNHGPANRVACPTDQAIVGLGGNWGVSGAQLVVRCASIVLTGDATSGYGVSYGAPTSAGVVGDTGGVSAWGPFDCPPGTVGTGLHIYAGEIIDGLGLDCGTRSPFVAVR